MHLFGQCADMAAILDARRKRTASPCSKTPPRPSAPQHPLGAAGAIGAAGWFSFYPTKNLGAFGDAGMVVCHDDALAAKIRALRNHGMEPRYYHPWIGGNFRIDAIQAAVLNVKLPHLDTWSAGRRARAAFYRARIRRAPASSSTSRLPVEALAASGLANHHIYNQFIIRTPQRDALRAHLTDRRHRQRNLLPAPPPSAGVLSRISATTKATSPKSERAARETLALPIFPELTDDQQTYVVTQVATFLATA